MRDEREKFKKDFMARLIQFSVQILNFAEKINKFVSR